MKKKTFFISFCLSVLAICFLITTNYSLATADAVYYISDGVLSGYLVDVVPPSTLVVGSDVTKIGSATDDGMVPFGDDTVKDLITAIDLKNASNLTIIDASVFKNCTNMAGELFLPASLESIGRYAFQNTKLTSVVVNRENSITTITSNSLPNTIEKVIFPSSAIMATYMENSAWQAYEGIANYYLTLQLVVGEETIDTDIKVVNGEQLGENYSLINDYLTGYDIESIKYNGETLSSTSVITSNQIIVKIKEEEVEIPPQTINKVYGEEIILSVDAVDNATYVWTVDGVAVENNSNIYNFSGRDANTYLVECAVEGITNTITTFNVVIDKAEYDFDFPAKSVYEYFEFSGELINTDNNLIVKYQNVADSSYVEEVALTIGNYRAIVELSEPLKNNYKLTNNTFDFELTTTKLSISWGSTTYNYSGEFIFPIYEITGNTWGVDIVLDLSDDSVSKAKSVGTYRIVVEGINSEYFEFTNETIKEFEWKIVGTTLTIKWELMQFDYTSEGVNPVVYGEYGDISIPLVVSELNTGNKNFVDADTYNVEVSLPEGYTGFTLSGDTTNTLVINPVKLDVRFISEDEYTYSGQVVEILAEITTDIGDNQVELIITGNKYKDAGHYSATVTGVSNPNYYIEEEVVFNWKINPKTLVANWMPLRYVYNGEVQVPRAMVDTGINGERITLKIISDFNKNVNEDNAVGYSVKAELPDGITNYILTNATKEYFITRADAMLSVADTYEVPYTGENILPPYEFFGDKDALIIKIDGVETTTGVKEVGEYEVVFSAGKSQNYNALAENVTCQLIIKKLTASNKTDDGKITISATSKGGIDIDTLDVSEITDYDKELIKTIDNHENYKVYRALMIGTDNYSMPSDTVISINLSKVNENRVRIFLISGNKLIEKDITVEDNAVVFKGQSGRYLIMVEKQNWLMTPIGITTISLSVFALVIVGVVVFLTLRPKKFVFEKAVNKELKRQIKEKVDKGIILTEEEITKLRQHIQDEMSDK